MALRCLGHADEGLAGEVMEPALGLEGLHSNPGQLRLPVITTKPEAESEDDDAQD
jgi:hypothetical protein